MRLDAPDNLNGNNVDAVDDDESNNGVSNRSRYSLKAPRPLRKLSLSGSHGASDILLPFAPHFTGVESLTVGGHFRVAADKFLPDTLATVFTLPHFTHLKVEQFNEALMT